MTLDEIWTNHRQDLRLVAFRLGTADYVALGHHTPESALKSARNTDASALTADDWDVGEIVPCPMTGQAKDVVSKANRDKDRSRCADWGPNRAKGAARFSIQDADEAAAVEQKRLAVETDCRRKLAEDPIEVAAEAARSAKKAEKDGGK